MTEEWLKDDSEFPESFGFGTEPPVCSMQEDGTFHAEFDAIDIDVTFKKELTKDQQENINNLIARLPQIVDMSVVTITEQKDALYMLAHMFNKFTVACREAGIKLDDEFLIEIDGKTTGDWKMDGVEKEDEK